MDLAGRRSRREALAAVHAEVRPVVILGRSAAQTRESLAGDARVKPEHDGPVSPGMTKVTR
ncbi:hypothetical protein BOS5A_30040 [Bosea sp. EC-HK365B]|nr:hypothetical protein BOSE21B_90089 [Bosea sp. 21B]CAD5299375.1 hypothetical protein BOSE7B_60575 [Bosea sp. 7B]VVT62179.1 hypothetical protein BOS5A_30040 [Bosea sp. EC-HK365B]VXB43844.1 hypothetical protein BOSE127_120040 [Bosea sp. 127]